MPTMLARQPVIAVISAENADKIVSAVPWRFALVLLGLAAALIILGAVFPGLFAGGFNHFGPDTP
jgi:hypothetical protein